MCFPIGIMEGKFVDGTEEGITSSRSLSIVTKKDNKTKQENEVESFILISVFNVLP